MNTRPRFVTCTAVLALTAVAACTDAPAISDPVDEPVDIEFRMQRLDGGASMQLAGGLMFPLAGEAAPVSVDDVTSLTLTVDSIQVRSAGEGEDDGPWVTVVLDAPAALDLKALPSADDSPIVIASGTLDAGTYSGVRLFVSDPVIVFNRPISLGAATTYDADTEYTVTIPSATETGIKTNVTFEAVQDSDIDLFFDEGATFENVAVTGNGRVMLAPIIRGSANGS